MSKDLIDTGVAGDSTTGDDLFTGGRKINTMFQEIYDAFAKVGASAQTIHATGYFQTPSRNSYTFPIAPGSKLNVDTRNGSLTVKLPNGKIGEMVHIRDVYGSWANSPITVKADGVEKIDGAIGDIVFGLAFSDVVFVCIDDTPGAVNWTYALSLLDRRDLRLIDKTFTVTSSTPVTYTLGTVADFTSVKMVIAGLQQIDATAATSSEIHLIHDGVTHVYNESSVLGTGNTRVYDVDFSIQSGAVLMTLTTTMNQVKVQVRSTDFTRIII